MLSCLKLPCFKLLNFCKLDEKIAGMAKWLNQPMSLVPYMFYPRIYRISEIAEDESFGRYNEES